MVNYLRAGLAEFQGEYADLRYEIDRIVQINVRGKEINYISDSTKDGFHLRCLVDGGLATQSFSDRRYLKKAIKQATRAARMAGRYVSSPIRFKAGPVVKERVLCRPREDPRKVSLNEKLKLLLHYNRLVLSLSKIQSTNFFYREWVRTKYFVNSLGSELEQEQVIAFISGEIIARDGNTIENVRVAVGGGDDFSRMRKREDQFEAKAKIAIDLLRAEPVAGGVYEVLLNPHMVGVFIHEAFGHFSEADLVYKNPGLLNKLQIGTTIGSEVLTVIDDPTLYGRPGYRTYDDEGTACKKVYLIKDGRLQGRLHSIETAFALNEEPNGHAIAVGWEYTPLVRMGNIYIAPGEMSFEELLSSIDDGLYICDAKGGSTMGDQFAFGAQYGYEIKKGKLGKMVKGINMSGNLFRTLKEVKAVGKDLNFSEAGGCGKKSQTNPQSGTGGPHTIIKNVVIG